MSPLLGRPALTGAHLVGRALLLMLAVLLAAAPLDLLIADGAWFARILLPSVVVIGGGVVLRVIVPRPLLVPVLQGLLVVALLAWLELSQGLLEGAEGLRGLLAAQPQILRAGIAELATGVAPVQLQGPGTVLVVALLALLVLILDLAYLDLGWHTPVALALLGAIALPALHHPGGVTGWAVTGPILGATLILLTRTLHGDPRYLAGDPRPQAGPLPRPLLTLGAAALCVGLVAALTPGLAQRLPVLTATRFPVSLDTVKQGSGVGPALGPVMIDDDVSVRRSLLQPDSTEVLRFSTDAAEPSYLRMNTLNRFDGEAFTADGATHPDGDLGSEFSAARDTGSPIGGGELVTYMIELTDLGGGRLPTPDAVRGIFAVQPRLNNAMFVRGGDGQILVSGRNVTLSGQTYWVGAETNPFTPDDLRAVNPGLLAAPFESGYIDLDEVPQPAADLAAQVVEETGADTVYDTALAFQQYFRSSFGYSLTVRTPPGQDPLESFLEDRIGYCEQFAATFALMMIAQGYPTRVVIGFTPGTADGDEYVVTTANAHAWPEVWFGPQIGWVRFEPTPAAAGGAIQPAPLSTPEGGEPEPDTPDAGSTTAPEPQVPEAPEESETSEESESEDPSTSAEETTTPQGSADGESGPRREGSSLAWGSGLLALATLAGTLGWLAARARARAAREHTWADLRTADGPAESRRRAAAQLAWGEIQQATARRGAGGLQLDPALPPSVALSDLLDQIAARGITVGDADRDAAARLAAARSDALYAPPVGPENADGAEQAREADPVGPLREDVDRLLALIAARAPRRRAPR